MRFIGEVDKETWLRIVERCSYSTFFHTPLWGELCGAVTGAGRAVAYGVESARGGLAIIPLIERPSGHAASTYAGCYGGIVADGPLEPEAEVFLLRSTIARVGLLKITQNPLRSDGHEALAKVGASTRSDFTHILTLDSTFDEVVAGFRKGHRSSMRKGRRLGVTTRAAQSLGDYRDYYGAYQDSLRRWGEKATSEYPWALFERCHALAQTHHDVIRLWVSEIDGRIIGGGLVFYWKDHAVWWHGAAYEEYFDYCPNNVLQADIIRDAIQRGVRFYDFNPSGGHEGVARFKDHFGADQWPIHRWRAGRSRDWLGSVKRRLFSK